MPKRKPAGYFHWIVEGLKILLFLFVLGWVQGRGLRSALEGEDLIGKVVRTVKLWWSKIKDSPALVYSHTYFIYWNIFGRDQLGIEELGTEDRFTLRTKVKMAIAPVLTGDGFDAFTAFVGFYIAFTASIVTGGLIVVAAAAYQVNKRKEAIMHFFRDTALYQSTKLVLEKTHFIVDGVAGGIAHVKGSWSRFRNKGFSMEAKATIVCFSMMLFWFIFKKMGSRKTGRKKGKLYQASLSVKTKDQAGIADFGRQPRKLSPRTNGYVNMGMGLLSLIVVGHFEIYQRFKSLLAFANFIPGIITGDDGSCIRYGDKEHPCLFSKEKGDHMCSTCSSEQAIDIVEEKLKKFTPSEILKNPLDYSQHLAVAIIEREQTKVDKPIEWFDALIPVVQEAVLDGLKLSLDDYRERRYSLKFDSHKKEWYICGRAYQRWMEKNHTHRSVARKDGLGYGSRPKLVLTPTNLQRGQAFVPASSSSAASAQSGFVEVAMPAPISRRRSVAGSESSNFEFTDSGSDWSPRPSAGEGEELVIATEEELRERILEQITDQAGVEMSRDEANPPPYTAHTPNCPARFLTNEEQQLLINHECVPEARLPISGVKVVFPERVRNAAHMFEGWIEEVRNRFKEFEPYVNYVLVLTAVALITYGIYYGYSRGEDKESELSELAVSRDLYERKVTQLQDYIDKLQDKLDNKDESAFPANQTFAEPDDDSIMTVEEESALDKIWKLIGNDEKKRDDKYQDYKDIPEQDRKLMGFCEHEKACPAYGKIRCDYKCRCPNPHRGVCPKRTYVRTQAESSLESVEEEKSEQLEDESNLSNKRGLNCIFKTRRQCTFLNCVFTHEDDEKDAKEESKGGLSKHRAKAAGHKLGSRHEKEAEKPIAWLDKSKQRNVNNDHDLKLRTKRITFIGYGTDALLKALAAQEIQRAAIYSGSDKVGEVANQDEWDQARQQYGNNLQLVPLTLDRSRVSDFFADTDIKYKKALQKVAQHKPLGAEELIELKKAVAKREIIPIAGNLPQILDGYKNIPGHASNQYFHPTQEVKKFRRAAFAWADAEDECLIKPGKVFAWESVENESLYNPKQVLKRSDAMLPIDGYNPDYQDVDNIPNQALHKSTNDHVVNVTNSNVVIHPPLEPFRNTQKRSGFGFRSTPGVRVINQSRLNNEPFQEHRPHILGLFSLRVEHPETGKMQHQGMVWYTGQRFITVRHNFINKETGELYLPLMKFMLVHPITRNTSEIVNIDDFNTRIDVCKPQIKDGAEFIRKQLNHTLDESQVLRPYKMDTPKIGEPVWLYSYDPNGNLKVNRGFVHSEPVDGWFRTTYQSEPGDSGGPVFNFAGSVVGIHKGALQEGVYNMMLGFTLGILEAIRDNRPLSLVNLNFTTGRLL